MKRPYVICHMCTTIDGKILTNRWKGFPVKESTHLYESTAASFGVPAWIVGTTTMKEFSGRPQKLKKSKGSVPPGDHIANPKAKSLAIGIDANAVLRFQKNDVDGDHTVVCITEKSSQDYRAHLQAAGVSYLLCGKSEVNLAIALEKLVVHFKLKKLMLEGGGKFNGSMLAAGLVDEVSQIIVPVVDGGMSISSIFDVDPAPKQAIAALKLKSRKSLPGGIEWLRYLVKQ